MVVGSTVVVVVVVACGRVCRCRRQGGWVGCEGKCRCGCCAGWLWTLWW